MCSIVRQEMIEEMKTALHRLVGEECWSSVAGEGTGSIFSLKFGEQFKSYNPVSNPHLRKHQREYDSHLGLMVWSSWCLSKNGTEICDSESDNHNNGPMVAGLKRLEGNKIREIECENPAEQICLCFEDGYELDVFCNGFELYGEDGSNYVVFLSGVTYWVTTDGSISKNEWAEQAGHGDAEEAV